MSDDFSGYQLVTWFLIVAGWLIVNWQHNKRESRKEARVMADNGKRIATEVAALSIEYFCSGEEHLAATLKSEIEILEIELERFPLFKDGSTLMARFIDFSESVTGGDFESQSRVVLSPHSPVIGSIRITRNALLSEIEHQFKVHFC